MLSPIRGVLAPRGKGIFTLLKPQQLLWVKLDLSRVAYQAREGSLDLSGTTAAKPTPSQAWFAHPWSISPPTLPTPAPAPFHPLPGLACSSRSLEVCWHAPEGSSFPTGAPAVCTNADYFKAAFMAACASRTCVISKAVNRLGFFFR